MAPLDVRNPWRYSPRPNPPPPKRRRSPWRLSACTSMNSSWDNMPLGPPVVSMGLVARDAGGPT
jgi:hypothetical protein